MLSSIHPLGERARHNRWWLTATAFTTGTVAAGAVGGAVLGGLGALTPLSGQTSLIIIAAAAILAGLMDLGGVEVLTNHRQVNERWIGTYRGWVYGLGFGSQLGIGFATYVVTWMTYATAVAALVAGSALPGALVGAAFGLGRAIPVLGAGVVDRPSRLTSFNQRLARLAVPVHRTAAAGGVVLGLGAVLVWS